MTSSSTVAPATCLYTRTRSLAAPPRGSWAGTPKRIPAKSHSAMSIALNAHHDDGTAEMMGAIDEFAVVLDPPRILSDEVISEGELDIAFLYAQMVDCE